jgi:hypothetical protein
MMGKRIPMKNGDELDALTKWKRWYNWRAGQRKRIKRGYRRRERHLARLEIQSLF